MSDEKLRALERRWKETGAVEDEHAYLREGVRTGQFVETGFIQRLKGSKNGLYRSTVRFHLPESIEEVSLKPIIGNYSLRDVEYFNDKIHLLAYRGSKYGIIHSIAEDGSVDKWDLRKSNVRIGTMQGLLTTASLPFLLNSFEGYPRCVNREMSGFNSSWYWVIGYEHRSHGPIVDWSPNTGLVTVEDRGIIGEHGRLLTEKQGELGQLIRPQENIYIQDQQVTVVRNIRESEIINSYCEITDFHNIPLPTKSRPVQERFVAPSYNDLARYHMVNEEGSKRVLREVPRKNIEGLLKAVERSQHGK